MSILTSLDNELLLIIINYLSVVDLVKLRKVNLKIRLKLNNLMLYNEKLRLINYFSNKTVNNIRPLTSSEYKIYSIIKWLCKFNCPDLLKIIINKYKNKLQLVKNNIIKQLAILTDKLYIINKRGIKYSIKYGNLNNLNILSTLIDISYGQVFYKYQILHIKNYNNNLVKYSILNNYCAITYNLLKTCILYKNIELLYWFIDNFNNIEYLSDILVLSIKDFQIDLYYHFIEKYYKLLDNLDWTRILSWAIYRKYKYLEVHIENKYKDKILWYGALIGSIRLKDYNRIFYYTNKIQEYKQHYDLEHILVYTKKNKMRQLIVNILIKKKINN